MEKKYKNYMFIGLISLALLISGCVQQTAIPGTATPTGTACKGIASTTMTYNDIDKLERGTDPAGTLAIYEKNGQQFISTVADDGTLNATPLSKYKALAFNSSAPLASYFASPIEFESQCKNFDLQAEVYDANTQSSWTILNTNGATVNSAGNPDAIGGSSDVTWTHKIRAPTRDCNSVYGAILGIEYDPNTWSSFDAVNNLEPLNLLIIKPHITITGLNATNGSVLGSNITNHTQWATFKWNADVGDGPGKLCNGKEATFVIKPKSGTAEPTLENTTKVVFHWFPLNYDIDSRTYKLIGPLLYDEDNNIVYTSGYGNATGFVS